ncbi:MAG: polysaccharide pyruvyl transferase family protein, partial [Thermotogaceae bacterium]|nr:polysaccharide pyruvyl transferase family protein [Thermotogaceae bacterium]
RDFILRKAVVVGYYGYGNFGDEILLKSVRRILKNIGFNSVGIFYPSTDQFIAGAKVYRRFSIGDILSAIIRSNVVVFGGGGLYQDVTSFRSFLYYDLIAKISVFLKKPVIFLGTSFGPLKRSFSKFLLRRTARKNLVYFFPRDKVSERYLKHLSGNVYAGTDVAIEYLRSLNINCKNRYDVIVVPKYFDEFWEDIVKNFKLEGRNVEIFIAANEDMHGNLRCYPSNIYMGLDIEKIVCSNLILSERFHPNLVAMYFGVPFVSVGSKKTEYFSREFLKGYSGFARRDVQDVLFRARKVESEVFDVKYLLDRKYDFMVENLKDLTMNL